MSQIFYDTKNDLDQYARDFEELRTFEENAVADWQRVAGQEFWQPSEYERFYLPNLRLAGIREKQRIVLQNAADVHMHTHWSDGDQLERVLEFALKAELDAIAITDHDEIGGALEARRIVHERRLPIAIIPGVEVSSRDGHIGALFVTRIIPKNLSAAETVRLIHEAGGIAVAHHPYTPEFLNKLLNVRLNCGDLIKTVPFDAVECSNAAPGTGQKYNIAAIDEMRRNHINIAVTGGSDAHIAEFVGKARTYYAGNEGILSLRNALKHGLTKGAEGYWQTSEKLLYYSMVSKAILRSILGRFGGEN